MRVSACTVRVNVLFVSCGFIRCASSGRVAIGFGTGKSSVRLHGVRAGVLGGVATEELLVVHKLLSLRGGQRSKQSVKTFEDRGGRGGEAHNLRDKGVIGVGLEEQLRDALEDSADVEGWLPGALRGKHRSCGRAGRRGGGASYGEERTDGGGLRRSRQMQPAESTLGWCTGVRKATPGGSNG